MVYTIGSGATPSVSIGQGAVPSSSSVPIGRGATPNFNWKPPAISPPRIDIPSSTTTSSNNNRPPSRSVNIDFGTRNHHHHRRHSYGCDDYNYRHGCDDRIELGALANVNLTSSSIKSDWRCLGVGIVCLLMLIGIGVLFIVALTNDWFKNADFA